MQMHNLLQYSDNYFMTSRGLWNRNEINDDTNENDDANNNRINNKYIF